MFHPIRKLGKLDYKVLLKNKNDKYTNDDVNKEFQKWNKKYGLNLKFDDEHADRNNKNIIAQTLKQKLINIENNEDNIITSLVRFYYSKPSARKKRLLWYVYGDKLYQNLCNNIGERTICHQCGAEVNEKLIHGKCFSCRQKELKEHGYKLIKCKDCGKDVMISRKNTKTCRCEECQKRDRNRQAAESMKKKRKN